MSSHKPLVLVSGATGFIGAWVVREFLDNGYRVRGTVRDLSKQKGKEHLNEWLKRGDDLELVEATLDDSECWVKACEGCDFVAHVASPFFVGCPDNEAEEKLFKPARDGTLNVLRAAKESGTVKRVVVTSSVVAIHFGYDKLPEVIEEPENMWTNMEKADNYAKSKTMAEKAAWAFVEEATKKNEDIFELATINPALVIGPPLSTGWATSHELPKRFLNKELLMVPDFGFGTIDVRDVAKAHRLAIEKPDAAGNRFPLQATATPVLRFAQTLLSEFQQYGYNFSTQKAPYFVLWLAAFADKELNDMLPQIGQVISELNCSKAKEILGMTFIDEKTSMLEHTHGCLKLGIKGFNQTDQYRQALANNEIGVSATGVEVTDRPVKNSQVSKNTQFSLKPQGKWPMKSIFFILICLLSYRTLARKIYSKFAA